MRFWEAGTYPVPDGVRVEVERLEAVTGEVVTAGIQRLLDVPDPTVVTYRTDAEYRATHPDAKWPASWHRVVTARVAQEVPGLSIVYRPRPKQTGTVTVTVTVERPDQKPTDRRARPK